MSGVVVAIPWRPSGSPDRERAFEYVHARLHDLDVLGVATFDADPSAPFSRGRSANLAFGAARAMGADVVIVNDADMILPDESYYRAVEEARDTGRLVVGFNDYRALDKGQTADVFAGADPFSIRPAHRLSNFSVGGIGAMTIGAWEAVGGFDPRFTGWAPDDWTLWHAAKLIIGEGVRLDGPAVHFYHAAEKDRWPEHRKAGEALHARYVACTTAEEAMAIRAEVRW